MRASSAVVAAGTAFLTPTEDGMFMIVDKNKREPTKEKYFHWPGWPSVVTLASVYVGRR